jgi:hypothetical protein
MRPEDMTLEDRIKIAAVVSRFFEAIAAQEKRDGENLASLVRALRRGGAEVDLFRQLPFQQEDSSKNAVSRNHRERAARST